MIHYIFAFMILVIFLASLRLLLSYLRFRASMTIEYGEAVKEFFDAAKPLMSDEDVPSEVRQMIKLLSDAIDDKRAARIMFRVIGQPNDLSKPMPETAKVAHEFFATRPELEEKFDTLFASWFVAITALDPVFGPAIRVTTFNDEERMQGLAERTIVDSHSSAKVGNIDGAAAASC